jgi:hypothetical protein
VLAADAGVGPLGVFGIAGEDPLAVADEGDREAVDLGDAGKDLAAVVGAVLLELADVGEAGQDLDGVVGASGLAGDQLRSAAANFGSAGSATRNMVGS